jgi:hypothetical protein
MDEKEDELVKILQDAVKEVSVCDEKLCDISRNFY